MQHPALERVLEKLNDRIAATHSGRIAPAYSMPGLWLDPYGAVAASAL